MKELSTHYRNSQHFYNSSHKSTYYSLHPISRYVRYQASPVAPDPSPNDHYYGQRVEQPTAAASAESSAGNNAQLSSSSSFEKPQPTYDPTYRYKREDKQPFSHLAWSHWHICRNKYKVRRTTGLQVYEGYFSLMQFCSGCPSTMKGTKVAKSSAVKVAQVNKIRLCPFLRPWRPLTF